MFFFLNLFGQLNCAHVESSKNSVSLILQNFESIFLGSIPSVIEIHRIY